jgi:hypothetical protein
VRWSSHDGFPAWASTTIIWQLGRADNGGTEVKFSHSGGPADLPQADLAFVNYTWGRTVGRLKKYVETGEPVPFFP